MYPNNYGQPPFGMPPYGQPGFQQGFVQPMYPPQGFIQPGFVQPGFGQPGFAQPGFIQPGLYRFTSHCIENQAAAFFMRHDYDRSGTLNLGELHNALNEFCLSQGAPPLPAPQFYALARMFDFDGSGQLDFFEFKMLLEQLGGIRTYDLMYIQDFRRHRGHRLHRYRAFW